MGNQPDLPCSTEGLKLTPSCPGEYPHGPFEWPELTILLAKTRRLHRWEMAIQPYNRLTAECHCDIPDKPDKREPTIKNDMRDGEGKLVATVWARWLIGPETHAD